MTDHDRQALIDRYRTGVDAIDAALAGIDDAELDRLPPGGEWSPRQIVHHLADSEARSFIRLRRLIAEDRPEILGYDEPEYARRLHYDRPIAPSLEVVRAVRASSLQLLESLTPDEWEREGTHSESGSYSVDDWLRIYAAHPHEHADQLARARRGEA